MYPKLPQLPEVSATCLPCCKTFKLSPASEKYFYITGIINRRRPHFKLHNKSSDSAGLSIQSKTNTFFKAGEASIKMSDDSQHQKEHQPPSTQTQHDCIGFGSNIGLNLFNANESSLFTATENSAFAFGCLKKTRNPEKICLECVKTMKSPGVRKKAERLRNADVKPTKYKPFTCYPKEGREALRYAGKQKKKESDRGAYYKKTIHQVP